MQMIWKDDINNQLGQMNDFFLDKFMSVLTNNDDYLLLAIFINLIKETKC